MQERVPCGVKGMEKSHLRSSTSVSAGVVVILVTR